PTRRLDLLTRRVNTSMTLMPLILVVVTILFVPMIIKLIQLEQVSGRVLQPAFHLGTIVLFSAGWLLYQSKKAMMCDDLKRFRWQVLIALLLGMMFLMFQGAGWIKLNMFFSRADIDIVKVISPVHGVHLLLGLISLTALFFRLCTFHSAAELYIHFLSPKNKQCFKNLLLYLAYIGGLWVLLYCVLLLKAL
ncbi:MAG: cytochrome c oxidase subunit 3, partial [Chitinophagaceae bacterium]|nr:cytochrome c oxidase subunit 3 [Chitinophagaceae bacterium]